TGSLTAFRLCPLPPKAVEMSEDVPGVRGETVGKTEGVLGGNQRGGGSPPPAWGRQGMPTRAVQGLRFTPTRVGKTGIRSLSSRERSAIRFRAGSVRRELFNGAEEAPDGGGRVEKPVAEADAVLVEGGEDAGPAQGGGEGQALVAREAGTDLLEGSHSVASGGWGDARREPPEIR